MSTASPGKQPPNAAGQAIPVPRKRRLLKIAKRLLAIAVALYILIVLLLALFQTYLTFPGAYIPTAESRFAIPRGCAELNLRTASDIPLAGLFLPAFTRDEVPTSTPRDYPTILYFYGNGQVVAYSFYEIDLFRRCGANVLVADYPGFGLSGRGDGLPSEAGCYAEADALYEFAISSPNVDPQRIYAVGWSLGGAMAIHVAEMYPVAGLMTLSSFTTLDEVAAHRFWFAPTSLLLKNHFPSQAKIRGVKCPTLVVHGDRDWLVPYAMHEPLVRACGAADVEHVRIAGAGHNDIYSVGYQQISEALRGLLRTQYPRSVTTQPALAP